MCVWCEMVCRRCVFGVIWVEVILWDGGEWESFGCELLLLFQDYFGVSAGVGIALGRGSELEVGGSHRWAPWS